MGARVQCPHCDQAYALSDEQTILYAGRDFECSQCGTRFVVPSASLKSKVTVRGELPRENLTAGASRAVAAPAVAPFTPTFIPATIYPPVRLTEEQALGSGLAIAALICGIVGLIVPIVPAVLAILLGAWAVMRIHRGKADGASMASGAIALGCAGLVIGTAILYRGVIPQMVAARSVIGKAECSDHFKTINTALTRYASAHQGHFPDGLDVLVAEQLLTPDALICPFTSDTKARGASAAEIAEHVRQTGHCSYVYTGKALTKQSPAECVLLYEPLDAHQQSGINVLFVDGRVQTIGKVEAAKAIARLANGQNPPWSE